MNKVLFAKLAVILLVMIVLAVPSSAWAQVTHTVQLMWEAQPVVGADVSIWIDVAGQGWTEFAGVTNASGVWSATAVPADDEDGTWRSLAPDYEGNDPNGPPWAIWDYPRISVLLDDIPGGWR